jgi:hypothetical protein
VLPEFRARQMDVNYLAETLGVGIESWMAKETPNEGGDLSFMFWNVEVNQGVGWVTQFLFPEVSVSREERRAVSDDAEPEGYFRR